MGLGLQRDHALDVLHLEPVARRLVLRCELLHHRALCEGHVVLIGGENLVGVLLRRLLDHLEEARLHLLAVDDEGAAEDLVSAVLGVDLCEAEDLRVGQPPAVLLLQSVQVFDLLGREGQSLLLVVFLQILHVLDGLRLDVDGEDGLVEAVVHALQHLVVLGVLVGHGPVLLDAADAAEAHVLGDLHGVGRPRGDHFAARAYVPAPEAVGLEQRGLAVEPAEFLDFLFIKFVIHLGGNHRFLWGLKEAYHTLLIIIILNLPAKLLIIERNAKQIAIYFSHFPL